MDKYDEQVERLLPCSSHNIAGTVCSDNVGKHFRDCAAYHRPAVAEALRELEQERDRWKETCRKYVIVEKEQDDEIADLRAENEQLKAERKLSVDREWLGKLVRLQWVKWAETQADAKSDWLVPWEQLEERYREVDRQIGEFIASQCVSPELLKVESERDQLRAQLAAANYRYTLLEQDFDKLRADMERVRQSMGLIYLTTVRKKTGG